MMANPIKISPQWLTERLNESPEGFYTSLSYSQDGSSFYGLIGEFDRPNFYFDSLTGSWNIRKDGYDFRAPNVLKATKFAYGRIFAISDTYISGSVVIGEFSRYITRYVDHPDFGIREIKRSVITKHLYFENKNIKLNSFELSHKKGQYSIVPSEILLYISRDGGVTYGDSITLSLNSSDDYKLRSIARMLGISRDFVFKIESLSEIAHEWFTVYIDYEVLNA